VQAALSSSMAGHAKGEGLKAHVARLALATLPRGGGDGDAIRMTILNLLRDNGIKEGHRPGIECAFLAQWHQKLHSNTTRDDIAIGEAYLHFLHGSGDWGDFWWHLYEHHGLTKEDLEGMKAGWRTQGITGPAQHLPFLIPAGARLARAAARAFGVGPLRLRAVQQQQFLPSGVPCDGLLLQELCGNSRHDTRVTSIAYATDKLLQLSEPRARAVQHLLWVLKVTHSGTDLNTAADFARGGMPGDLQWDVDDLLQARPRPARQ
jgi:hypothetical protein